MKYLKLWEEFSHKMILFNKKEALDFIPEKFEIIWNDEKISYKKGDVIPSDSKLEVFYTKKENKTKPFKGVAPLNINLRIMVKSESTSIINYLDTKPVLFLDILVDSPLLSIRINNDGDVNHIIPKNIELSKGTKDKIVKLVNKLGMKLKVSDI